MTEALLPAAPSAATARLAVPADRVRTALDLVGVALVALYVGMYAMRYTPMQGDFRAYVAAAHAASAGLDPYRPEHLTALAGRPTLPFVYPPITLPLFLPLAALPHGDANRVWMLVNAAVLASLVVAWRRWLPGVRALPLVVVAAFGWNGSALWALRMGNAALLEAGLIWGALECWVRGHRGRFAALIVAAACFKLLPAALLLLLLAPTARHSASPRRLAIALAALAMLVGGPLLVEPARGWEPFLRHLPSAEAAGPSNPGGLGFATALARMWGAADAVATPAGIALWAALMLGALAVGLPLLRDALAAREPRRLAMTALFLYVLVTPRPMAYGFVLLAPALFFLAPRRFTGAVGQLALAVLFAAQGLTNAAKHGAIDVLYVYAPFLLTLCLWLLVVLDHTSRRVATSTSWIAPSRATDST